MQKERGHSSEMNLSKEPWHWWVTQQNVSMDGLTFVNYPTWRTCVRSHLNCTSSSSYMTVTIAHFSNDARVKQTLQKWEHFEIMLLGLVKIVLIHHFALLGLGSKNGNPIANSRTITTVSQPAHEPWCFVLGHCVYRARGNFIRSFTLPKRRSATWLWHALSEGFGGGGNKITKEIMSN